MQMELKVRQCGIYKYLFQSALLCILQAMNVDAKAWSSTLLNKPNFIWLWLACRVSIRNS